MSPGGLRGGETRDEIKGSRVISEDSGPLDPLTIIRWRVSADGSVTQCGHASRRGWRDVAWQSLAPGDIRCRVPCYGGVVASPRPCPICGTALKVTGGKLVE